MSRVLYNEHQQHDTNSVNSMLNNHSEYAMAMREDTRMVITKETDEHIKKAKY